MNSFEEGRLVNMSIPKPPHVNAPMALFLTQGNGKIIIINIFNVA